MTNDLTECIRKELTTSLGGAYSLLSVHLSEGWGDILYVTIRISGPRLDGRDGLDAGMKSAVDGALGDMRHLVKIEWAQ